MSDTEPDPIELPSSFVEEFQEIYPDLHEDYRESILTMDLDAHRMFKSSIITTIGSGRSHEQVYDDLATAFMMMILVGREHHARGLPNPIGRQDAAVDELIPDSALADFLDGVDPDDEDDEGGL